MENFYRENSDELLEICQIRQYFVPSKFCAIRYIYSYIISIEDLIMSLSGPFHSIQPAHLYWLSHFPHTSIPINSLIYSLLK